MSKTDRILGNLPAIYKAYPRPSALYVLANAAGVQLQEGENLLTKVMKAHWIDYADRERGTIVDLALLGALFDLLPFADPGGTVVERVEDFRARIKRSVQTYLQGTATARGIMRVAADTLGVTIDEDHFSHPQDDWLTRLDDATRLLFGLDGRTVSGRAALPAQIVGASTLDGGVWMPAGAALRLKIGGAIETVTLVESDAGPQVRTLDQIVAAINTVFDPPPASHDDLHLILTAPDAGASSTVEVLQVEGEVSDALLGIGPRLYLRSDARPAQFAGTVDLSGGVDLSARRYLRLLINDTVQVEVDCAEDDAGLTSLDDIVTRINTQTGITLASTDGRTLTLTTPGTGSGSLIQIDLANANDAAELLLGPDIYGLVAGADAQPARFTSRKSLIDGLDLRSGQNRLRIKFDSATPIEFDLAAPEDEPSTPVGEIVSRMNAAAGKTVATQDGMFITLTALNRLEILTASQDDGAEYIVGLLPRSAAGQDAESARLEGAIALPSESDLRWQTTIEIGVDGVPPQPVVFNDEHTTPAAIVAAINEALGGSVADLTAENHLVLTSPTSSAASRIELAHRAQRTTLHFATQVPLLDSGAGALLGFNKAQADTQPATSAQIVGVPDLSRGVDLRTQFYLRVSVDGGAAQDINCQGSRARVTPLTEIVTAINTALEPLIHAPAADTDAQHLVLTSPQAGHLSCLTVESSTATDAAELLLGTSSVVATGTPVTSVTFTGLVDLSTGIDVADHYRLTIGLDGAAPVDIDLRTDLDSITDTSSAVMLSVGQIVDRINHALRSDIATHDGARITLQSSTTGAASQIAFAVPADHDATLALLGITTPRAYGGVDDAPAELWGTVDLTGPLDLSVRHHLRVALDGEDPLDVNCAGDDPAQTRPDDLLEAIRSTLGASAARLEGSRLVLTSRLQGAAASVEVTPSTAADASALLLGSAAGTRAGQDGRPASLTGTVTVHDPVRLRAGDGLRLVVDGEPPVIARLAGPAPDQTPLGDILAGLNALFPPVGGTPFAALNGLNQLQLTAQQAVGVQPRDALTLIEFPPIPADPVSQSVEHGTQWTVTNPGAAAARLTISLTTQSGITGPRLDNVTAGATVQVPGVIRAGQTLVITLDEAGQVVATLDGAPVTVEVDPSPAALMLLPGKSTWQYRDCTGSRFDTDRFDDPAARFAGGQCRVVGVWDASTFITAPDAPEVAVFAPQGGMFDAGTVVSMQWSVFAPGYFQLELPYGLDRKFGARFDKDRFIGAQQSDPLVIELNTDPGTLVDWVNTQSSIVAADAVDRAPDGFVAQQVPMVNPISLTGGDARTPARLYVTEQGLDGAVELRARMLGEWGNAVQVLLESGDAPGTYRVTITYAGCSVFENARALVCTQILKARAAGVESIITRRVRE